jgi:hypothetical protein
MKLKRHDYRKLPEKKPSLGRVKVEMGKRYYVSLIQILGLATFFTSTCPIQVVRLTLRSSGLLVCLALARVLAGTLPARLVLLFPERAVLIDTLVAGLRQLGAGIFRTLSALIFIGARSLRIAV